MFIRRPRKGNAVVLIVLLFWLGVGLQTRFVVAQERTEQNRDLAAAQEKIAVLEAALNNLEAVAAKEKAVAAAPAKAAAIAPANTK